MRDTPEAPDAKGAVTREQLGHLGGNARFQMPTPDRACQIGHGIAPTTDYVAIFPWWWPW